jgi:hypothetical protein
MPELTHKPWFRETTLEVGDPDVRVRFHPGTHNDAVLHVGVHATRLRLETIQAMIVLLRRADVDARTRSRMSVEVGADSVERSARYTPAYEVSLRGFEDEPTIVVSGDAENVCFKCPNASYFRTQKWFSWLNYEIHLWLESRMLIAEDRRRCRPRGLV